MPFPVDRQFIEAAETRLGVKFPNAFTACMQQLNGGNVWVQDDSWELHTFLDLSSRSRARTARNEICQETLSAWERPDFPPNAIAVASNGSVELLVLLADEDGALGDEIFWWSPDALRLEPVADDLFELRQASQGQA